MTLANITIPRSAKPLLIKRALSLPAMKIETSLATPDNLLQSSTPGKRRYMRRGSRCPSMFSMPFSLSNEISILANTIHQQHNYHFSTEDKLSSSAQEQESLSISSSETTNSSNSNSNNIERPLEESKATTVSLLIKKVLDLSANLD